MRRVKNCSLTEKPSSCDVVQKVLTMDTQSITCENINNDNYFSSNNSDVQYSKKNPYFRCFDEVSHNDVYLITINLALKTSLLDILLAFLLKRFSPILSPIIAKLANLSFSQSVFLSNFKTAQVILLLRILNLEKFNLSNYTPVSNLTTLSKILEKIALFHLSTHLFASSSFKKFQSARNKLHSCETVFLHVTHTQKSSR